MAFSAVSGKPPLLLIITADPLLAASRLVLPKGSFHLEETTEILTFFKTWDRRYKVQVLKDNGMCGKTRNSLAKKTLDELNTIYMKM